MERLRWPRRGTAVQRAAAPPSRTVTTASSQPAHASGEATVQVIHGAGVQSLPLAGLSLAQARPLVEAILGVDPRSPALVNGRPARATHVITGTDVIEFVHLAGEKGAADGPSA